MSERNESSIHPVFAVVGAIVVSAGIIAAYVWATWTGPVHAGQVTSLYAYPIHRELSTGSGLGGVNGGPNVIDEVIVIADVQIKSTTKLPLFLGDMFGNLTLPDGQVEQSLAASGSDYRKVFVAYPALLAQQKSAVPRDVTMKPGQTIAGQMIFHFPITQAQWNGRKGFDVDIRFIHQDDLVLHTGPPQGSGASQ
ncbi:MAG TPA: hypothetical protein VHX13_09155 [Acidobacteriaceae bacterium]|jgi:hypothetical protein|nr:hypothetical protein [Acidobacteriaceae bacterium]